MQNYSQSFLGILSLTAFSLLLAGQSADDGHVAPRAANTSTVRTSNDSPRPAECMTSAATLRGAGMEVPRCPTEVDGQFVATPGFPVGGIVVKIFGPGGYADAQN